MRSLSLNKREGVETPRQIFIFFLFMVVTPSSGFQLKRGPSWVQVKSITQALIGMRKVRQYPTWAEFCCKFNFGLNIFPPLEKKVMQNNFFPEAK